MEEDNWPDVDTDVDEAIEGQADYEDQADIDEEARERAEEAYAGYPTPKTKDTIFTFFRHVLGIKDSSKVGNLSEKELGILPLSVRNCQYLGLVGQSLNHDSFKNFFNNQSQITLATSASKKGWLVELVVSQKKFAQRTVKALRPAMIKKGLFSRRVEEK